jgi:hypothetical protein
MDQPGLVVHAVIPALGRLKWEDYEFQASLGNIVRTPSQQTNKGWEGWTIARYIVQALATLVKFLKAIYLSVTPLCHFKKQHP